MNILAIGNSFSHDGTRYLHGIARSDGFEINVANLVIGGCSADMHFRNMLTEREAYDLHYNGESTGFLVSLKEALLNRAWDYVTVQQASHFSFNYETYQPYFAELCAYIRKLCPKAKILVHQTWAYEQGSVMLANANYSKRGDMFSDVEKSYERLAKEVDAEFTIKSGKLMQMLLENGIPSVNRDGYHLSYGLGRYAAALLWYALLSKKDVTDNKFCDFDEEVSESDVKIIKKCVKELVNA
jgi:hypothetical protein